MTTGNLSQCKYKLANDALTQVGQRVEPRAEAAPRQAIDPSWANRRLLLGAGNTLSASRPSPARGDVPQVRLTRRMTPHPSADITWNYKNRFPVLRTTGSRRSNVITAPKQPNASA